MEKQKILSFIENKDAIHKFLYDYLFFSLVDVALYWIIDYSGDELDLLYSTSFATSFFLVSLL